MTSSTPPPQGSGSAPTVSVVIPCYRQASYLTFAVSSVALQSFEDWELIIVDDGSPDDTALVASNLIAKLPDRRIRLVRQGNGGLAAARNAGIRCARGRYLLPLDADDALDPEFQARTVEVLERDPQVAIVGTDLVTFGVRSGVVRMRPDATVSERLASNEQAYASLYRREVWDAVGGYNPNMVYGYEDWDFWIGAARRGFRTHHVPEPLFFYRIKSESMVTRAVQWDRELRARMVLNHAELFGVAERAAAERILAARPMIAAADPVHSGPDGSASPQPRMVVCQSADARARTDPDGAGAARREAIVTLAVGDRHRALFDEFFRETLEAYAARIGVRLIVFERPLDAGAVASRRSLAWQKLLVFEQPETASFDRLAWIDSDVLATTASESVFHAVPSGRWGGVTEEHAGTPRAEIRGVQATRGLRDDGVLLNTGVLVLERGAHASTLADVYRRDAERRSEPERRDGGWFEEPFLSEALLRTGPGRILPIRWNRLVNRARSARDPRDPSGLADLYRSSVFLHWAGRAHDHLIRSDMAHLREIAAAVPVEADWEPEAVPVATTLDPVRLAAS